LFEKKQLIPALRQLVISHSRQEIKLYLIRECSSQHSDDVSKGYGTPLVGSKLVGLNLLRRSELDTTVMELAAMAAAAKIGFKKP